MHKKILISLIGASLGLLGCPAADDPEVTGTSASGSGDDDDSDSDSEGETEDETSVTETSPATSESESDSDPTDPSDSDTDPTGDTETTDPSGFITDPDGGSVSIECSVWDQDCPEGEKCMPWANDGGNSWNATRCSPLDPAPNSVGDPCQVEGSGVSGVDDCEEASMCWGVDPKTNEGTCVAFCGGNENNPICDDPTTACSIANEGTLILCLPTCDPLLQDCADGDGCWGIDDDFVCAPDASGEEGAYGDPCAFLNVCDPGLFCANPAVVPDCVAEGCCSEYCDLTGGSGQCMGEAGGQMCISPFEKGQTPPGYEDVGVCAIPL